MHPTFNQPPTGPGMRIRGTSGSGSGGLPTALPKLLAVLVAVAVVRRLSSHAAGGHRSGRSRRRDAIAKLHEELHREAAASEPASA